VPDETLDRVEEMLLSLPGVHIQMPANLQPPFRAKVLNLPVGYQDFHRNIRIDPVVGYTVPAGARAVIVGLALGVDYQDNLATWTDPLYEVFVTVNGVRVPLITPTGRLVSAALASYDPQSENLVILANEASTPVGPGTVTAGISENPYGLLHVIPTQIQLKEFDEIRVVYDGTAGDYTDEDVDLYARLFGWVWPEQEMVEGDVP